MVHRGVLRCPGFALCRHGDVHLGARHGGAPGARVVLRAVTARAELRKGRGIQESNGAEENFQYKLGGSYTRVIHAFEV